MEYYLSVNNEDLSFVGHWVEIENIMIREINMKTKGKCHILSFICGN